MSLTDAYVKVVCDKCHRQEEEAELPFSYRTWSGSSGFYDHTKPRLPEGWACIGDDEHHCPECVEAKSAA